MILEIATGVFLGLLLYRYLPVIVAAAAFYGLLAIAFGLLFGAIAVVFIYPGEVAQVLGTIVAFCVGIPTVALLVTRYQTWRLTHPNVVLFTLDELVGLGAMSMYLVTLLVGLIFVGYIVEAPKNVADPTSLIFVAGTAFVLLIGASALTTRAFRRRAKLRSEWLTVIQ